MPNPRKKIILNEILYWKQNKLLPDHYCDFLITLYSEGNEVALSKELSHKKSIKAKEKQQQLMFGLFAIIFAVFLLGALFLTKQLIWLVAIIVSVIAIITLISAFYFAKKNQLIAPILQIAAALLVFGLSVKLSLEYYSENPLVLYVLLIINCFMWLLTGIKFKLMYFTISGSLGILVLIGYQIIT